MSQYSAILVLFISCAAVNVCPALNVHQGQ